DGARGCRRLHLGFAAIGQNFDAVLDSDRHQLAAMRAAAAMRERLLGREPHAALAMTVEVIFSFVRAELDGTNLSLAGLCRALDREIVALAVKRRRFAREFSGRMRVGIRGE